VFPSIEAQVAAAGFNCQVSAAATTGRSIMAVLLAAMLGNIAWLAGI
jgi:hypothetical protein